VRARYDVVIVGYGPVGALLAILLAQRGWQVGVLEKQPAAYPLPRAVHFDHEVARILQSAGLGAQLGALTEAADAYEWRNAAGATLLRFASAPVGLSGWPDANMFAQPELERLLDARVRQLASIDVHRGCEVVAADTGDTGASVTAVAPDGRRQAACASFVVGCDGANSLVRSALGSTVTDLGFFFDWLIVDVLPHRPVVWRPLNVQVCDPARPTTLVSGGPGRRRWEFMRLPGERIEDLNTAATAWRLLAPWDVTPENVTLERHTVYRFQARWVDGWRRGRLVLAGDAAHQMPPFAGQGMCSGLRDAANLAWKIDLVLRGQAREALLDTYASERIPHVRATIDFSMALGKVICIADSVEAAARDAAMAAETAAGREPASPPPLSIGPGLLSTSGARAGRLFVQGRVRRGAAEGRFDDVLGGGWTLVSPAGDPAAVLDAQTRAFFASLGGRSAHLGAGGDLHDLDGTYARWFESAGVAVALQRPDFYLFGTAAELAGANELVCALRAQLSGER